MLPENYIHSLKKELISYRESIEVSYSNFDIAKSALFLGKISALHSLELIDLDLYRNLSNYLDLSVRV